MIGLFPIPGFLFPVSLTRAFDSACFLGLASSGLLFTILNMQRVALSEKDVATDTENMFKEGDLSTDSTIKDFLIVRQEGNRQVSRSVEHYHLDAIISVGYRVKSAVATRFRIWATQKLRELMRGRS